MISLCVVRVDDHIIQRMPFCRSLKCDAINDRSRKAARVRPDQHRQQIRRADLALKMASCRSACCGARRVAHLRLRIPKTLD